MEANIQANTPPGYSQVVASQQYGWQNSEAYPSGAVVDVPRNMTLETIGADNFCAVD